jgi:protein-S-isoprenylcysteine O-methyltransferase Ste14
VHRGSGSAGSSAALRLAHSGKPGSHLARSSSSSNSITLASHAAAGAATAAAGAGSRVVAAVLAVLTAVVRFGQFAVSGVTSMMSAAAGGMNLGQGQAVMVLGVLAIVGVQLALLWQVVALQQRVVDLLQVQQQAACGVVGVSGV